MINTTLPSDFVTIKKGELFECNNVAVTRYNCSAYRTMTFEEFKRDIVPTLQEQNTDNTFYHYESTLACNNYTSYSASIGSLRE